MVMDDEVIRTVQERLAAEPRMNLHHFPILVHCSGGMVVLDGEVDRITAKRIAVRIASAVPGARGVEDRLCIRPTETVGDAQVRDHLAGLLLAESAFTYHGLQVWDKGHWEVRRQPLERPDTNIQLKVDDGVVQLAGSVLSLSHKRLAGALAWWTPGSRDVRNSLQINPPEEDNDDEITDAVRLVLEQDPLVIASQIIVATHDGIVTLTGLVPNESEKDIAEYDAWYIDGVRDVHNQIMVAGG